MVEVREAKEDEAAVVRETMLAAFEEYRHTLKPPSGALKESLQDVAACFANGGAVLAFRDGVPVGSARYELRSDHVYCSRISVVPSSRGLGIASQMLTAIDGIARERGFREVRLSTREVLISNQRLYKSHGYEVVSSTLHPQGEGMVLLMSKTLA